MPPIVKAVREEQEADIWQRAKLRINELPYALAMRNGIASGMFAPMKGSNLLAPRYINAGLDAGEGSTDMVCIVGPNGRFAALEAKRPGEKPKPHQELWMARVRLYGGFAGWFTSDDEAMACIERARNGESQ